MRLKYFHVLWLRIFSISSALLTGFLSLKLYSHYLTPDQYGMVLVALVIIGYLPMLDGGFRTVVNRALLAEPQQRTELIRFSQRFYSWFSLFVLAAALLGMGAYWELLRGKGVGEAVGFFLVLGLAGSVGVIGMAQADLLVGLGSQGHLFLLLAINSWLMVGGLWAALALGLGVWAFPIATLCGSLGIYPIAIWMIRALEPKVRFIEFRLGNDFWTRLKRFRSDAWACFRGQISVFFLYTIDVVLVGVLCSPEVAAVYGILAKMFAMIRNFLQAAGEAAWPFVAEGGLDNQRFGNPLLRINAWCYGAVLGSVSVTLLPFLQWFLGKSWTASAAVFYFLMARTLAAGLAAPASYLLFGLGEVKTITKYLQRELIAGTVLAFILGKKFGAAGVALGFAAGSLLGTAWPLMAAYARSAQLRADQLMAHLWARFAAGFCLSFLAAEIVLGIVGPGWRVVIAGLSGFAGTLLVAFFFSLVRNWAAPAVASRPRLMAEILQKL